MFLPKEHEGKTIGISRFALIDKTLVEFSVIVNIKKSMNEKESIKYAQSICYGLINPDTIVTDKQKTLSIMPILNPTNKLHALAPPVLSLDN